MVQECEYFNCDNLVVEEDTTYCSQHRQLNRKQRRARRPSDPKFTKHQPSKSEIKVRRKRGRK